MTASTMQRWEKPADIDDTTAAFPARVTGTLLPPRSEVPVAFRDWNNAWNRLATQWFFEGLDGKFIPKDGIDGKAAVRHLATVLHSFEPKHEDKTAGVAYLMSLWFDRYEEAK